MWCLDCFGCWDISLVLARADAGEARFWKLNSDSDYGVLERLARQRVKAELIEQNWDDLLRIAGSLKLGTVSEA